MRIISCSYSTFEQGKVPPALLKSLVLSRVGSVDPCVVVGPAIGEDSAIIRLDEPCFISATTDPISGAMEKIGHLAVHVNANDVAASGGKPRWFLLTQLFPVGTDLGVVERISRQVDQTCRELDVAIVGGHTEFTRAVDRPILIGTMLGTLLSKRPIKTAGARVGDRVILTKGAGLEGTAILCQDRADQLVRHGVFSSVEECLREADTHAKQLSVVRDAHIALSALSSSCAAGDGPISSMHDPTEGGIAGALHEVAECSGKGFVLRLDQVPVSETTRRICSFFKVSPFDLISSGALLLCVHPASVDLLLDAYRKANVVAADIGVIVEDSSRRSALGGLKEKERAFPCQPQDALWSALEMKDLL